MIRFPLSLTFLTSLPLIVFPSVVFAQSNLTDDRIAKRFYPTNCQIIKGRIDNSSPINASGQRYAEFQVNGERGQVAFAEFTNTSNGTQTGDLVVGLSIKDASVSSSTSGRIPMPSGFLPRLSWRFPENQQTLTIGFSVVPDRIPSDYEVMIVWTKPSAILSNS
jgi:hypothetical protein